MREGQIGPDAFFHRHRGGRNAEGALAEALAERSTLPGSSDYWDSTEPQSMLIEEVESIWDAIAQKDDWQPLADKIARVRALGDAMGDPPVPAGHLPPGSE